MTSTALCALLGGSLVLGCAAAPKPQELTQLETMREGQRYHALKESQAELMAESDTAFERSTAAWQDGELDVSKHWAELGTIKMRTAIALQKKRLLALKFKSLHKQVQAEQGRKASLAQQLKDAGEKAELYAKLDASVELADAQKKISAAQLAQKQADSVDARKHADATYRELSGLLNEAVAAAGAGNASIAAAKADMAKAKAEAAYAEARPAYLKARSNAKVKEQNAALQKDIAGIAGVTVSVENVGPTRQLVVPVLGLFKRRSTTMIGAKESIISALSTQLKKHKGFQVVVNGYTSYRVPARQRYEVSKERAQAVANKFIAAGVESERVAVAGRGVEKMAERRRSGPLNERVEVIIILK
ncbi:MAG: OmpA family protein [Polyangiales bacterium]